MNIRPADQAGPNVSALNAACTLSVVVPVFNEEAVLPIFHARLVAALEAIRGSWEIVYVDDGSGDATPRLLAELRGRRPELAIIRLSRNFGKEAAMTAGLRLARGQAVV